jgi:hypothetical protein
LDISPLSAAGWQYAVSSHAQFDIVRSYAFSQAAARRDFFWSSALSSSIEVPLSLSKFSFPEKFFAQKRCFLQTVVARHLPLCVEVVEHGF